MFSGIVYMLRSLGWKHIQKQELEIKGTCAKIFGKLIFFKLVDVVIFQTIIKPIVYKFVLYLQAIRDNNCWDEVNDRKQAPLRVVY